MFQHDLKKALRQAVETLNRGEPVGMPTETVYGLAADARRSEAVAHIFRIKNRPFFDPLIVHIHHPSLVEKYASSFPPLARRLADRFWPGPLTLILPKRECIPDLVTSGLPDVAIRIPNHPVALALLEEFDGPLAAPSANKFRRISPTTAAAVREELGDEVETVLDGGSCPVGIESTIVYLAGEVPTILRQGGISEEQIVETVGDIFDRSSVSLSSKANPAPGMLSHHYAPRTPLRLLAPADLTSIPVLDQRTRGLLAWGVVPKTEFKIVKNLSSSGSATEGASSLFGAMRELDHHGLDEIIALEWPQRGLGRAINDRFCRAQHK